MSAFFSLKKSKRVSINSDLLVKRYFALNKNPTKNMWSLLNDIKTRFISKIETNEMLQILISISEKQSHFLSSQKSKQKPLASTLTVFLRAITFHCTKEISRLTNLPKKQPDKESDLDHSHHKRAV